MEVNTVSFRVLVLLVGVLCERSGPPRSTSTAPRTILDTLRDRKRGPEGPLSDSKRWLGMEESNPHVQIQNLLSYH